MFIIERLGSGPVMDHSKGKPREFKTKEDAISWANLSCYRDAKIKRKD